MKNFLLLFYFFILSSNIYARVLPQDIIWNDDESGYYIIKDNSIVLVSTQGEDDKTILASSSVNNVDFKSFNFSVRKDKLLIFTNTVKVWRYETRGDYWVYDFNTRKATKIGATMPESSLMFAKFSPDGSSVAYVSKENSSSDKIRNSSTSVNIYIEDLKTNSVKQLTSSNGTKKLINGTFDWVYEEEFGCRDGFLFNDSGTKIAFWQIDANQVRDFFMINNTDSIYSYTIPVEYPKVGEDLSPARIGVIDLATDKISWIKIPGESNKFYLPRMTWLPNKDELMIQQLNRKQNHSKIFIADSESGQSRLLMEETDDAWVDLRSSWPYQVQAGWKFINNGKEFLYTTEKDGWSHIYRFNIKNKKEYLVTKGSYDVVRPLAYDEQNKEVYFIASPENPTERYLYKTSVKGNGKLQRVTPLNLEGSHNYQISTKAKYAFHSFSNYYTKPMQAVISLPSHDFIYKEQNMVSKFDSRKKKDHPLEFFEITTVDNVTMEGWIVKPKNLDVNKKYPVLFYFYSEPAGQTGVNRYGAGNNGLYDGNLSEDGYVYVTFDGRGTPSPKGRAWRKAIYRNIGRINVRDMAMGAKAVFEKYDFIDTTRVAVHGWSGGGTATLNCLFQYPEIFHTGIAVAAVANQLTYDNIYQERYMGDPKETYQDYVDGSPIKYAKNLKGNLLYIHGTGDDNVHYQNAEMLANELIKHKKVFYMLSYPNRSHGIREDNAYPHVRLMFTDFLRKNCPPGGK
ncbi:MAG: DPP IV N-terminal domain-containing protein [Pseudomonadota bacterium]|nr:DPP IV N-terminal domain-containing protein [Pseudomonadota bacterium]